MHHMTGKRTRLRANNVIGFDGRSHVIWRNGEIVIEGTRIIFVGRGFEGRTDGDIDYGGAMIGPGFIDLDALGDLDSTVLTLDNGPDWTLGRIWTETYLREGPREAYSFDEGQFKYRYAFTQLIRNGITTAMPITSMSYRQWGETYDEFAGVAAIAGELGIRAYLGPCYMSGVSITDEHGNISQHWDEAKGLQGLEAAERYIRDFDGKAGGLIRACLLPDRIETCTPALLARTAEISREANVPVRLHCCQSRYEVALVKKLRGTSAYRWLDGLGLLSERAVLPHGIEHAGATAEGMGSMKSQLKRADGSGARFALIFGATELAEGYVAVKPLRGEKIEAIQAQTLQPLNNVTAWAETLRSQTSI